MKRPPSAPERISPPQKKQHYLGWCVTFCSNSQKVGPLNRRHQSKQTKNNFSKPLTLTLDFLVFKSFLNLDNYINYENRETRYLDSSRARYSNLVENISSLNMRCRNKGYIFSRKKAYILTQKGKILNEYKVTNHHQLRI